MRFASLKDGYIICVVGKRHKAGNLVLYLSEMILPASISYEFLWRKKIMFSVGVSFPSVYNQKESIFLKKFCLLVYNLNTVCVFFFFVHFLD